MSSATKLETGTPYYIKRYWFYLLATVVSVGTPFITINGNHIFLLSFDQAKLHLMGIAFDMQEFYLMPFLLMFLFTFIFFITTFGGRVWCGWACPQTIFRVLYRDFIQGKLLGMNKRKNKQKETKMGNTEYVVKNTIAILIWSFLAFLAAADLMWYFVPPELFFEYIKSPMEHTTLFGAITIIALFLIYDVVKLKEDFCSYICPYVRIQSVLYDNDTIQAIYDTGRGGHIYDEHKEKQFTKQKDLQAVDTNAECTTCEACVTVCPTHIDIRKGTQLECINCLECVDACTTVMGNLGKESLVRWESEASMATGRTHYFRFRTIAYIVALSSMMFALFYIGSTKETMLLNINKSNQVYQIEKDMVTNDYVFLISNTDSHKHEFALEVADNENITIIRPTKPFEVGAESKMKKIVKLATSKDLSNGASVTTRIPVMIKAYAVDEKDKIFVYREAIFAYPPQNEIRK